MSLNPPTATGKSEREIFAAALRCAGVEERRALIEAECGSNSQLRETVEALLEESSALGDFLERPAVSDTRVTGSGEARTGPLGAGERLGDRIGPYELVDFIGEGGGGSVYLAEQSEPVRRTVALKILKLGMDTRSVIARFEAERQALATMEHPNIARVIDAGATEEGRPYFVMDHVPGEPVTTYCDAHRLTVEQRLSIFVKVCRAVEHAHQKGIIHRDLKPSNILVTDQDGEAVPKIIDFGVAKAVDPLTGGDGDLTLVETIIGTPAYMSPEQAEKGPRDVDTRSDVYSLGVLLHELLTGHTPLGARGARSGNIDEALKALRESGPVRPSALLQASPREEHPRIEIDRATTIDRLAAKLRGDLDWVVMNCLERDRSRRFGSASELARDIERYLAGEPVTARPPSAAYRFGKLVRRHRAVAISSCLLVLTLVAAAALSMALAIRATRAEQDMRVAHRVQSELRADAVRDRESALRSAAAAHLHRYVADINLSHHALLDGHISKALHLLDRHAGAAPGPGDLRGFEWRYLAGLCLGDQHDSLPPQDAPIESLAFSPDAELLAVATRTSLRVWSLGEARPTLSLVRGASSVAFFPDGHRLVAAGRSGVAVYDLDSGRSIWNQRDRDAAMALSPDGLLLATNDRRGVSIWKTEGWDRERYLPRCSGPLAFSPDGKILATGTAGGITLWPVAAEKKEVILEGSTAMGRGLFPGRHSLAFSRDGQFVLLAQNFKPTRRGYSVGIWEAGSGKEVSMLPGGPGASGHAGIVSAVSFAADGSLLATSSWDHSLRLWDFESRSVRRTLHGHRGEVWCVAMAPGGNFVASGSKDGEVKIWPTTQSPRNDSIEGRWKAVGFSPNGEFIAADNQEGTLGIFSLRSGAAIRTVGLSSAEARFRRAAVSISRDLTVLAEGRGDGTVRIRNLAEITETSFRVADRAVDFVALSPGADTLVTGGWRGDLAWWNLRDPSEPIARIAASQALFSADGQTLVTLGREGEVVVWDGATRRERLRMARAGGARGSRMALSPDGKVIAMTHGFDDFENAISLWDTTSGKRLGTLTGHKQGIWSLAFSPDGRTLASSSGGGTLRLWSVAAYREFLTIRAPGTNLDNLRFSPDGQYLAGSSPSFAASPRLHLLHAPRVPRAAEGPSPDQGERTTTAPPRDGLN